MAPRLVVLSGPLTGQSFALEGDATGIGRSRSNAVCLPDESVSRQHCIVRAAGDGFELEDLGSRHGLIVNGEQIQQRRLRHGDRIEVGDSVLQILLDDSPPPPARPAPLISLDSSAPSEGMTLELRLDDSQYLKPRGTEGRRATDRVVSDLNALVHVGSSINQVADPEALQERLLELVFGVIPARRGAILLCDAAGEIVSTVVRDAGASKGGTLSVSRTVIQRVLTEGIALLANDLRGGDGSSDRIAEAESVRMLSISAVLCVPLTVYGKRLGVLYLHSSDLRKPFDSGHLDLATAIAALAAIALDNARRISWAESEAERLRADLKHDLVGDGPKMREVLGFVGKVAPKDTTVLIRGESGTGKEVVARALHENSARATRSFVAINCAAMPETLLESELFGHEKGAFTGAVGQKKGKIEMADGGTLFLDEIGEMAPLLQAKLLRVLQERELERVGGTRPIKVDIRLIAATNRDLEEAIKAGTFRQDLYYRLNVVSLMLPALRERREDIPALATHFVEHLCRRFGHAPMQISPDARACLVANDWPGNVRELENALERAVVLASGDEITPDDLPEALIEARHAASGNGSSFHDSVAAAKRRLILEAFEKAGGSYTETAKLLGLNANYLHRLVKNLDLKGSMK